MICAYSKNYRLLLIKKFCFAYKGVIEGTSASLLYARRFRKFIKRPRKGGIQAMKAMKNLNTRIMSFLVAIMLVFGAVGQSMTVAYAGPNGGGYMPGSGGSGTGTGTGGGSTGSGIFDLVGDDGSINDSSDVAQQNTDGSFTTIITKYKSIAVAIMGILTITMLIFMLIQFTKLGAAGDNEMARKKAIMGILTTGIATALLGGATIIVGFFWGALTGSD